MWRLLFRFLQNFNYFYPLSCAFLNNESAFWFFKIFAQKLYECLVCRAINRRRGEFYFEDSVCISAIIYDCDIHVVSYLICPRKRSITLRLTMVLATYSRISADLRRSSMLGWFVY